MARSERGHITWPGWLFLAILAALYLLRSKIVNPLLKMNSINSIYYTVYSWLVQNGFDDEQAKFITAQAAHETGNFTSSIFKNNHNLFGMKLARIRDTTAIGERSGHAVYENIEKSLEDFKLYFKARNYLPMYSSLKGYIQALKNRLYFEADFAEYLKGTEHFYNLYFNGND